MHVMWRDYDGFGRKNAEKARYHVNAKFVGVGTAGFTAVLEKLEELPVGAVVHMYPESVTFGPPEPLVLAAGGFRTPLPVEPRSNQSHELHDIGYRRKLTIWCYYGPPPCPPDKADAYSRFMLITTISPERRKNALPPSPP
jgi:hypothetical protein